MERKSLCRALGLVAVSFVLMVGASTVSATDVLNMPAGQTSVVMLPVGNVGNAVDPLTGYGQVNYAYNIDKYDVTVGQYTAFLNAVAGVDTSALYNSAMAVGSLYGCGITQSGGGTTSNPYTYSVAAGFVNRPVTNVNLWSCCRFANWLNNGQPTGAEGAGTTETGAYSLNGVLDPSIGTITRNTGATWALPTENEGYKAAYYNPATGTYYFYPTSSNAVPGNNLADLLPGNNANYYTGSGPYPIDPPYYTTVVGQFQNSPSPYGTFDQGGNVWEWNEAAMYDPLGGLRGGSFSNSAGYDPYYMQANVRNYTNPAGGIGDGGFRVVQVPEPASLAILGLGVVAGLAKRRRAGR